MNNTRHRNLMRKIALWAVYAGKTVLVQHKGALFRWYMEDGKLIKEPVERDTPRQSIPKIFFDEVSDFIKK